MSSRKYDVGEYEPLAQLVEHLTFNQRVEGSSPSWLTILFFVPLVKWLRHRPFTAVTRVRIPYGSCFLCSFWSRGVVVNMPACHAGDRRFDPVGTATFVYTTISGFIYSFGSVAQSVEQRTENPRVGGSIPSRVTLRILSVHLISFYLCNFTKLSSYFKIE